MRCLKLHFFSYIYFFVEILVSRAWFLNACLTKNISILSLTIFPQRYRKVETKTGKSIFSWKQSNGRHIWKFIFWHVVFNSIANCRIEFIFSIELNLWKCRFMQSIKLKSEHIEYPWSRFYASNRTTLFLSRSIWKTPKIHTFTSMYKSNIYAFVDVFIYLFYENNIRNECESLRFKSMVYEGSQTFEWKMIEFRWVYIKQTCIKISKRGIQQSWYYEQKITNKFRLNNI